MSAVLVPVCVLAAWRDVLEAAAGAAHLLRADARARGVHRRGLRRPRRVPLLRPLRGHAHPGLLPHRPVRRRPAAVRGGEVPALLAGRRADHARRRHRALPPGHRAARRASSRQPDRAHSRAPITERLLFFGFFLAFAIKAPMLPVHTWLPDAAQRRPPATRCCWSACSTRSARSGCSRCACRCSRTRRSGPRRSSSCSPSSRCIYGALLAIGQNDLMRLIAYTSVSHFGFIVLGIFAFTSTGQAGSTLYMVNHGFSTAALFLIAGMLSPGAGRSRSPTSAACSTRRRCSPGVPGRRSVEPVAARPVDVRQRVPGARRHVHPLPGGRGRRDPRDRPGRALHPADLPADVHRARRASSPRAGAT